MPKFKTGDKVLVASLKNNKLYTIISIKSVNKDNVTDGYILDGLPFVLPIHELISPKELLDGLREEVEKINERIEEIRKQMRPSLKKV